MSNTPRADDLTQSAWHDRLTIEEVLNVVRELERDLAAKQAEIDRLMMEHCPEEMTAEQRAAWAKHQVVVPE